MRRSLLLIAGIGLAGLALLRVAEGGTRPSRSRTVADSMMDMGSSGMMGGNDPDMRTVMTLFANHGAIRRRVEQLPNGIRTTTESDDLRVVALLQSHVASMYKRVEEHRPFSMMSRTLPILFRNANRYHRDAHYIPKGVVVIETSEDPTMVEVIRAHGREVDGFVRDGMSAMMGG
jgi:hypothetical protein